MADCTHGMARGILRGSLAVPPALLTGMAMASNDAVALPPLDDLVSLPVVLAMGFVVVGLVALVVITLTAFALGLPLAWLLHRLDSASAATLGLAGAITGYLVVTAIALATGTALDGESAVLALVALVGGGVTGGAWGARREDRQNAEPEPAT